VVSNLASTSWNTLTTKIHSRNILSKQEEIYVYSSYFKFPILISDNIYVGVPVKKTDINGRGDPLRWPRDTLYPQKLSLTSPTSGGRSV
jgi:hypothetical protein